MFNWLRERLGLGPRIVTGLNWGQNILKLVAAVVAPFYAVWFGSQASYYIFELPEWMVTVQLLVGLAIWGSCIAMYIAHVKQQAASYLSFPSSKWRFSETQVICVDLIVKENEIEKIGEIGKDGVTWFIYRLTFPWYIGYFDPDRGLIGFRRAYWILQKEWDQQFFFREGGEIFYGGIPISHPRAEDVSLHVYPYHRWEVFKREKIPICVLHDSKAHYQASMKLLPEKDLIVRGIKPGPEVIQRSKEAGLIQQLMKVELDRDTIADEFDAHLGESFSIQDVRKEMISDHKRRYGNILRDKKPLRWRIFNTRNLVILGIIVLVLVFWFGYVVPTFL